MVDFSGMMKIAPKSTALYVSSPIVLMNASKNMAVLHLEANNLTMLMLHMNIMMNCSHSCLNLETHQGDLNLKWLVRIQVKRIKDQRKKLRRIKDSRLRKKEASIEMNEKDLDFHKNLKTP